MVGYGYLEDEPMIVTTKVPLPSPQQLKTKADPKLAVVKPLWL
jgi:hypothetical protein